MQPAIYSVDEVPVLQNRVHSSRADARACVRGDIRLERDSTTGIITNVLFDQSLITYDQAYNNEQSLSSSFEQHLAEVAAIIKRKLGTSHLFEVGCGKGAFLERLAGMGCTVSGCDPAYEGDSPYVVKAAYTPAMCYGKTNIILRHVLEHIERPVEFLTSIANANRGGIIYIEVPCVDWIVSRRAWFDVFYEHVNYFSANDFSRIFEQVEIFHLFAGQYMGVVANLSSLRTPGAIRSMVDRDASLKDTMRIAPPELKNIATEEIIWGAASKGVIYALMRERAGCPVNAAVDINPAKQGKYMPGTGVRIISPGEFLSAARDGHPLIVMNSNYLEEVKEITGNRFKYNTIDYD